MFFAKRVVIASLGQKLFVISLDQQIFYSLKRSFKHMGFYGDFQGELQLFRYIRYFVINRFAITRFKCSTYFLVLYQFLPILDMRSKIIKIVSYAYLKHYNHGTVPAQESVRTGLRMQDSGHSWYCGHLCMEPHQAKCIYCVTTKS